MEKVILREIYLIRHGQSMSNAGMHDKDNLEEIVDSVLSDKGLHQANLLGKYYKNTDFDAVYSSGLKRAVMTGANMLIYQSNKKLNILPDLCEIECNPGYKGATMDQLVKLWTGCKLADGVPETDQLCIEDTDRDERKYFERAERVNNYFSEKYSNGEKIAVVTHGAFMTYYIFYLMGFRDHEPNFDLGFSNTGVAHLTFYKPGTNNVGDMVIESINDLRHLD